MRLSGIRFTASTHVEVVITYYGNVKKSLLLSTKSINLHYGNLRTIKKRLLSPFTSIILVSLLLNNLLNQCLSASGANVPDVFCMEEIEVFYEGTKIGMGLQPEIMPRKIQW
jgi:hypothetical protein